MRVLVVAATPGECAAVARLSTPGHPVEVLVTGVGMVATAARVSRALAQSPYDLAINIGVCGAFDRALPLASVIHITSDRLAELGVEDGATFIPADELGLVPGDEAPFTDGQLVNPAPPSSLVLAALPQVTGITVNTVHGDEASIAAVIERYRPHVESMEGAAFMYACLVAGVPFAQVRAISNYVERRNRATWQLPGAIAALERTTAALLQEWLGPT